MRNLPVAMAALLATAALALGGCRPSPETLCKRICDCGSCSNEEEEGCVDGLEDAEEDASSEECGAEYDAYVSCLDEKTECDGDAADTSACDDEQEDLAECLDQPVLVNVANGCVDLCVEVVSCQGIPADVCQVPNTCNYEQNRCAACLTGGAASLCTNEGLIEAALGCLELCLAAATCEPGEEVVCTCADGSTGVSTCGGVAFGPCVCEPMPPQ